MNECVIIQKESSNYSIGTFQMNIQLYSIHRPIALYNVNFYSTGLTIIYLL